MPSANWDDLPFTHRYADLGPTFSTEVEGTPMVAPKVAVWNQPLADVLGLPAEFADAASTAGILSGNRKPRSTRSVATVYSGHQFGVWAGQLGDGRALLVGELGNHEIQLKGAGRTPYSRGADGRAVLRSSIREYLCSEAMHGLGIPTTRALALVVSPEPVWRETLETAAVVTRVAPSFLRFGHFEHFFHGNQHDALKQLADHAVDAHFPELRDAANPYQALLDEVVARTARLIAQWQTVGFCHGVMNTDNMSLLGLTIDYGPFGFLDGFDAGHICNHSDHSGRYSYANQPEIGLFNLHCLAQALLPLLDREEAIATLKRYQTIFEEALEDGFRAKLGLATGMTHDWDLMVGLFDLMQAGRTDWTIAWRQLGRFDTGDVANNIALRDLFVDREGFDAWAARYRARLLQESSVDAERLVRMNAVNPKFVLRNHLAETAIRAAKEGDYDEIARLQTILARPFDEHAEHDAYAAMPPDWATALSVSCSS